MELDEIKTKTERELRYRRGRSRNYPRFKKLLAKYKEVGEPMSLEDVEKYMGVTHHTLRGYAKDLNMKMIIFTDEEGNRWLAFKEYPK
ncbi:MAG: hypothetical protein JW779_13895 [Candidatus Thorarchaeota archaeon]|nr:hypothetical protein [Candidatus Thorarchaeota archaeon]